MKVLLVTGSCAYNLYQERCLREVGVDARIYGEWGMHLPEHVDVLLAEKPDIIHLQWPEALTQHQDRDPDEVIDEVRKGMAKLRASGIKLFWVLHNLLPHRREKVEMWWAIWQIYAANCDVACHHSQCGRDTVNAAYDFGNARQLILHHGYFDQFQPCTLKKPEARRVLGLPPHAHLYLSVGAMRPDKQIRELIGFFGQRDPAKDVLVLVGMASRTEYGSEMLRYAAACPNVVIEDGYIEDDRVAIYANACDAFLYLYGEHHLTSGSPHLSQAFLLPQISGDYAYAREVLGDGASYVAMNDSRYETLHRVLDQFSVERIQAQRQHLIDHRPPWHWPTIAAQTKTAYEQALHP